MKKRETEIQRLRRIAKEMKQRDRKRIDRKARGRAGKVTSEEREKAQAYHDGTSKHRFTKGNPGRPKGSKNIIPGGIRASVKSILEEVVASKPATIRTAIIGGIKSGPRHADRYLRLAAEYVDGRPVDTLNLHAQFKNDELSAAKESLDKKMDKMITLIAARSGTK